MVWLGLVVLAALTVVSISAASEFCNETKPCKEDEYCDEHSSNCAHCSQICTAGRPEFSKVDCNGRCKGEWWRTLDHRCYNCCEGVMIFTKISVILEFKFSSK